MRPTNRSLNGRKRRGGTNNTFHRWRRISAALSAGLVLVSGTSKFISVSLASDHRPPRVKLVSSRAFQSGVLTRMCWAPGDADDTCIAGAVAWPNGVIHAKRQGVIHIRKTQPPMNVRLVGWQRIRGKGWQARPSGKRHDFEVSLEPVWGRHLSWRVLFDIAKGERWYLELYGEWRDEDGGTKIQHATWRLHLRRK